MKIRAWLVLLAVAGAVVFSGCQRSAAKVDDAVVTVKTDAGAIDSNAQNVETQIVHTRDQKTGRMVLTQESVTTMTQKPEPKPAAKPVLSKNEYTTTWKEECTVQQAFAASKQVLEQLKLRIDGRSTRAVRTRDPKTGRTVTRTVPAGSGGKSDDLSALLTANSVAGIKFDLSILLLPPESCRISIVTGSASLPNASIQN